MAGFCAPSLAQEVIHTKEAFFEKRLPRAEVSGSLVLGAMLTPDERRRAEPELRALVPPPSAGTSVCVRVTSRDGDYIAVNSYALPEAAAGEDRRFEHPTKLGRLLERNNAVARMSLGDCNAGLETPIVPVLWNPDPGEGWGGDVLFYVNTGGADTIVAVEKPGGGEFVAACDRVEEVSGLEYTASCVVPAAHLAGSAPVPVYLDVTRNRKPESYMFEVLFLGSG